MKAARLVLGIMSILWSLVVIVLMGFLTLVDFGVSFDDVDGIIEEAAVFPLVILLGVFFLAGGIVMIVCHKKGALGGCIACAVIFGIGLVLSLIFGGSAIISAIAFIVLFIFSIAGIPVAAVQKHKNKIQQSV